MDFRIFFLSHTRMCFIPLAIFFIFLGCAQNDPIVKKETIKEKEQEQAASKQEEKATGSIAITIVGLNNDQGSVRVSLFNQAEGFPSNHNYAYHILNLKIQEKEAKGEFEEIPYGDYAVAVLHDENGNGKLDTNLIGIPKEGVGASNDARGLLGPPKFSQAKFILNRKMISLKLTVKY